MPPLSPSLPSWFQRNQKSVLAFGVLVAILIGILLVSLFRQSASCLCGSNQICENAICKDIIASSTFDTPNEQSFAFETLVQETSSRIITKQEAVIENPEAWLAFWERHQTGHFPALTSDFAPSSGSLPEIDFTKELVIAVFLGEQRTGGYAVEIEEINVLEKEAEAVVTVAVTRPNPQDIVTQVLTQPLHIVKVQKPNMPVRFRFQYE